MKKKVNVFRIIQFVIGVLKLAIEIFNFRVKDDEQDEVTNEDLADFTAEFSELSAIMVESIFKNSEDKEKFGERFVLNLKKRSNHGTDAV